MKRLSLIICVFGLMVASPTATALADVNGALFVTADSKLTAYSYGDMRVLWTADIASSGPYQPYVVPDGNRGVVVVPRQNETRAYDAASGTLLWTIAASLLNTLGMTHDIHRQLYTDTVRYPYGPPRMDPDSAPVIALTQDGSTFGTTRLVDSRTGTVYWTRTDEPGGYPGTYASQFFPNSTGSYDVIFSSGPFFTATGGNMFRVDGTTGTNVIWTRRFSNRSGIPVPDISGDGQYDFFASPSAWSSTVLMLDGATGDTVWSTGYGSFDVIGRPQVVARGDGGYDVIVSAQLSSAGGVRRYRTSDGAVVWSCSSSYNNNTILGLLERADGLTVLSGWRHRSKLVAFDASTGQVLWDSVPMYNSDDGAIGVPDLTGDGNQDVMALYNGWLRLYDGVTGVEQTWFAPIQADGVAYYAIGEVETDPPIADAGDDIIASANEEVTLDGSDSNDPDGEIIRYTWKRLPDEVVIYSGEEPTCQTKALGRVEEIIELTVTDNYLATATDTVRIINRTTQDLQDQVAAVQSQIEELQQQIQELQALVDKIISWPPIRQWLRRPTNAKD